MEDCKGISSFSWIINNEENTLCNFSDLEEALKWLIYLKIGSIDNIQDRNGKAPVGCPKDF